MAETYKPILPGNYVTHLNAHALPNESFKANKRAPGAPQDRHVQCLTFTPGWSTVRKVGYAHVGIDSPGTFDITVPSPDLREGDKPRADVIGLWVPQGAFVVRAGFRTVPASSQPGSNSSGPRDKGSLDAGITGEPGQVLVLATAAPATAGPALINGTTINTASNADGMAVDAEGNVPIGSQLVSAAFGTPQRVTPVDGLLLKLYSRTPDLAAEAPLTTEILGGAYIVCELVYMVPEAVADMDDIHVGGSRYSGFTS